LVYSAAWTVVRAWVRGCYQRIGTPLAVFIDMQATPMFTEEGTVLCVYVLPLSHSEWVHVVKVKGLMRRTEDGPD